MRNGRNRKFANSELSKKPHYEKLSEVMLEMHARAKICHLISAVALRPNNNAAVNILNFVVSSPCFSAVFAKRAIFFYFPCAFPRD